jgi:hypothetical protein
LAGLDPVFGFRLVAKAAMGVDLAQHVGAVFEQFCALGRIIFRGNLAQDVVEIEFLQGVEQAVALGQQG